MPNFILLVLCLLFHTNASSQERVLEHEEASKTFLNWHFFENGRGMTLSPDMVKFLWMVNRENKSADQLYVTDFIEQRYGFISKDKKLVGVFDVPWKGMNVGVLGCTGCHSGKAAGQVIAGLGNKTIDAYQIGRDLKGIQGLWGLGATNPDFKYIHGKAMNFAKVISDENISNLVRGVVSDSTIKTFFYKDHGLDYPKDMGRGQVKVPHLWGIKEKRPAGIFNDGALSGDGYGWIFGAELFASDSGEHLRAVLPKIQWLTDNVLGKLLPPKYPFVIKTEVVSRGETLFNNNCLKCHGDHQRDLQGFPIYTAPRVIEIDVVKTDREKINIVTPEFVDLVKTGSLGDILSFEEDNIQKGYFAPKLWGVWARFPYTHNGSVPTLYHMMVPQDERPEIFSMKNAGEAERYDEVNGGLTLYKANEFSRAMKDAKKGDRDIYYVKREGLSNEGHYFESFKAFTHEDRMAIVEYLKSLY